MMYCAICKGAICRGERSARYYLPIMPERIRRTHLACTRELEASAPHEDLVPVVVS